ADFLAQAESYARTGVLSAGQRSRRAAPVADRSRVQAAAQLVLALSERAVAEDLAYTAIDAEIKKLGKLTKDEVLNLAREVGITAPFKTTKAALAEIHRRTAERKES